MLNSCTAKNGGSVTHNSEISLLLRAQAAANVLGISKSKLWQGVRAGILPSPVKPTPGITAWRMSDLQDFVQGLKPATQQGSTK